MDASVTSRADVLRAQILELVQEYHAEAFPSRSFTPGESPVPVAGRVFDADEVSCLVDASLDFWLTTGRFAAGFERASGPSASGAVTRSSSTAGPQPTSSRSPR